jgi:hypothetical protein
MGKKKVTLMQKRYIVTLTWGIIFGRFAILDTKKDVWEVYEIHKKWVLNTRPVLVAIEMYTSFVRPQPTRGPFGRLYRCSFCHLSATRLGVVFLVIKCGRLSGFVCDIVQIHCFSHSHSHSLRVYIVSTFCLLCMNEGRAAVELKEGEGDGEK